MDVEVNSDDFWLDGCQVSPTTVPGGTIAQANMGATLTHEAGHWFGLFHTFEGGCEGGDLVDDTPAQANATSGCPAGKDTCTGPQYPGVDPIHNYMDYSDDSCMTEFTPGQAARVNQLWDQIRGKYRNANGSTGNNTDTSTLGTNADVPTSGSNANVPPSGANTNVMTPGSNTNVLTPGTNANIPTSGANTNVVTPESNTNVVTPGTNANVPTSGANTNVVTPGSNTNISETCK
ncbi:Ulilysin [Dactylellina cionopaga]|nr:Ulilysin [Dactylellina cionopaga]